MYAALIIRSMAITLCKTWGRRANVIYADVSSPTNDRHSACLNPSMPRKPCDNVNPFNTPRKRLSKWNVCCRLYLSSNQSKTAMSIPPTMNQETGARRTVLSQVCWHQLLHGCLMRRRQEFETPTGLSSLWRKTSTARLLGSVWE